MKSKENDLDVLFPSGKEVVVGKETFTITPFKLGQLPKVFKAIDPVSKALFDAFNDKSISQFEVITKIIADGDTLLDLISISTGKPRTFVDDLDVEQGVEFLTAIFEVNADFFIRKVLPVLSTKAEKMAAVGQTS